MSWASLILSSCSSLLPLFSLFFLSSSSLFLFFFLSLFSFSILSNSSGLLLSSVSLSPSPFFPAFLLPFSLLFPFKLFPYSFLSPFFPILPFSCPPPLSNSFFILFFFLSPVFLSISSILLFSISLPSLPQFLFPRISFPLSFHCLLDPFFSFIPLFPPPRCFFCSTLPSTSSCAFCPKFSFLVFLFYPPLFLFPPCIKRQLDSLWLFPSKYCTNNFSSFCLEMGRSEALSGLSRFLLFVLPF